MTEAIEGERTLRILVPALKGGRKLINSHGAAAPSGVQSIPPSRPSHKGTEYHGKNFPSYQGWVENMFHQLISGMAQTSVLSK